MDRRTFGIVTAAAFASGPKAMAAAAPLDGPRRAAARQPVRFLIVFLHGFGSNGEDMIGLAPSLAAYEPSAAFASPNAPYGQGDGFYSWVSPQDRRAGVAPGGEPVLEAFLDAELARHRLAPERLILIGFSQGASAVLNNGLRRRVPPAAIIAFAGNNLSPAEVPSTTRRPPVLLIQGAEDDRVSTAGQQQAMQRLKALGAPATAHILPRLGHTIDDRGIRLAGELIQSVTRAA